MQLHLTSLKNFLDNTLSEDLGIGGDITSKYLINANQNIEFYINAREKMVLCGRPIVAYFFNHHSNIEYQFFAKDGDHLAAGGQIVKGSGRAIEILALERTILNYLQHLSGIATLTNEYVSKIHNNKTKICDTRKTLPGLRLLQKYAVTCGGGRNHRFALDSSILIKDNHIAICGSIENAIHKAKAYAPHYTKVEVECDDLVQVQKALECGVDIIMLDNMSLEQVSQAVKLINNKCLIEVSGQVTLQTIAQLANLNVDFISIGRLTNSAQSMDIGLDI
ncbi:carboxylating nicotinate-nucleotide diphosphorylase [Candidatus Tisiphia endosymbiont of Nemotelus uliginosus]|uniref:carboxylating nicotinate-nucleotide diphosphorylase n=1 Tax=Candidatus Tisiphia endosymbiont of Nemotelus uliginosus TaxID=3077926 RepID=UPI0035C8F55C